MKLCRANALIVLAALTMLPAAALAVPYQPRQPSPLAGPTKAVAAARLNLEKAREAMLVIRKRVGLTFEAKPDWKAAKDSLDQANADAEAASHKALSVLEKTDDYKAMVSKRDKAQAIIDSSAKKDIPSSDDAPKLTDEDIANAQRDRIAAAIDMKKMEHQAETNDPKYIAARQKVKDAQAVWDGLQSQLDDAVKLDPAYPAAKKAVDAAELQLKQAQDAYAAAAKSAIHRR